MIAIALGGEKDAGFSWCSHASLASMTSTSVPCFDQCAFRKEAHAPITQTICFQKEHERLLPLKIAFTVSQIKIPLQVPLVLVLIERSIQLVVIVSQLLAAK